MNTDQTDHLISDKFTSMAAYKPIVDNPSEPSWSHGTDFKFTTDSSASQRISDIEQVATILGPFLKIFTNSIITVQESIQNLARETCSTPEQQNCSSYNTKKRAASSAAKANDEDNSA